MRHWRRLLLGNKRANVPPFSIRDDAQIRQWLAESLQYRLRNGAAKPFGSPARRRSVTDKTEASPMAAAVGAADEKEGAKSSSGGSGNGSGGGGGGGNVNNTNPAGPSPSSSSSPARSSAQSSKQLVGVKNGSTPPKSEGGRAKVPTPQAQTQGRDSPHEATPASGVTPASSERRGSGSLQSQGSGQDPTLGALPKRKHKVAYLCVEVAGAKMSPGGNGKGKGSSFVPAYGSPSTGAAAASTPRGISPGMAGGGNSTPTGGDGGVADRLPYVRCELKYFLTDKEEETMEVARQR